MGREGVAMKMGSQIVLYGNGKRYKGMKIGNVDALLRTPGFVYATTRLEPRNSSRIFRIVVAHRMGAKTEHTFGIDLASNGDMNLKIMCRWGHYDERAAAYVKKHREPIYRELERAFGAVELVLSP